MFSWNKMPVYFDGHDLSEYLNVLSLDRGIGGSRTNTLLKSGNRKGTTFSSYTYDEKVIPMGFSLIQDLISKRRELARILNVSEPKKLIFGDEPDKYYMAIPDGNINLDEVAHLGEGNIDWIIPDGVAYSVDEKEFVPNEKYPDQIRIVNNGGEDSKPILQAIMKSDNGFVSFTDMFGNTLQFGDPESADGFDYDASESVVRKDFESISGWTLNDGVILDPENYIEGEYSFDNGAVPSYVESLPSVWSGPSLYRTIPKNSNGLDTGNFEFKCKFTLNKGRAERNRLEFNISNLDNTEIPFGFVFRDSSRSANMLTIDIYSMGIIIASENLYNDFKYEDMELIITKFGDNITYKISEISKIDGNNISNGKQFIKSFTLNGISNQSIGGITLWSGRYDNTSYGKSLFESVRFSWLNVEKWENVSNLFSNGDILWIDTTSAKIYVNGVERPELETIGNRWSDFRIEPGIGYVYLMESSWATVKPDYKAIVREVWL